MEIKDTSKTETLERIVCRIERRHRKTQHPSMLVAAYHAKRKQASAIVGFRFSDLPGFGFLDSSIYFRVDSSAKAIYRPQRIQIEEGDEEETRRRISLSVSLVLCAARGKEFSLIEHVAHHPVPSEAIDEKVYDVVQKEVLHRRSLRKPLLDDFRAWRDELVRRVEEGLENIGLSANVVIDAWNPYKSESHEIDLTVGCRCSDHPGGVDIAISALVDPATGGDLERALHPLDRKELKAALSAHVADHFRRHVDINSLCLKRGHVDRLLQSSVEEWLKARGWSLARFRVDLTSKFELPPAQLEEKFAVSCMPRGRDQPIEVEHRVLLRLVDPLRALNEAGVHPLADIKAITERTTVSNLFDLTYVDIVLAFDEKRKQDGSSVIAKVAGEVREFAASLGYDVVHLTALPREQPNILQRDGIHLILPQKRGEEMAGERFELEDPRIKGSLLIDVDARLPNLEKLRDLISSQQDLVAGMEGTIRRVVARTLLKVSPHRFHMAFNVPDNEREALSEELTRGISDELKKIYFLEHVHTTVRLGMTPLLRRALDLAKGLQTVSTEFVLADEMGAGETARFDIRFSVDGIDATSPSSWYIFQARGFEDRESEIEAINDILTSEVKRYLDSGSSDVLRDGVLRSDKTQRILTDRMRAKVAEELGLAITVGVVLPQDTEHADALFAAGEKARAHWLENISAVREQEQSYFTDLTERRGTLLQRRRNMEDAGAYDREEAERLDREIESINDKLKQGQPSAKSSSWAPRTGSTGTGAQLDRIIGEQARPPRTQDAISDRAATPSSGKADGTEGGA
jgi:hypothetical protein